MSASEMVYVPAAPGDDKSRPLRLPLDTLAGKTVGFIDNAKTNFNHLVDDVAEILVGKYRVARVLKRRKTSPGAGAPREMIEELTRDCDAVVTGSGD